MSEHITVRGFVATDPQLRTAQAGFCVGNFRLAATDRRFDREVNAWVDGQTNWFTVNMFRNLAQNVAASLEKGQPVIVTGRLKVRPWETAERSGTAVEIEAESIGHDLSLGTARYYRSAGRSGEAAAAPAEGATAAGAASGTGTEDGMRVNRSTGEVVDDLGVDDDLGKEAEEAEELEDSADPGGAAGPEEGEGRAAA